MTSQTDDWWRKAVETRLSYLEVAQQHSDDGGGRVRVNDANRTEAMAFVAAQWEQWRHEVDTDLRGLRARVSELEMAQGTPESPKRPDSAQSEDGEAVQAHTFAVVREEGA